jgi:hypothetical protein
MTDQGKGNAERLSRAELAMVLQKAAHIQARSPLDEGVSIAEAELLATEVGIAPREFREAVRLLRSKKDLRTGWLGPSGALAAESSIPRRVGDGEALQYVFSVPTAKKVREMAGSSDHPHAPLLEIARDFVFRSKVRSFSGNDLTR